MAYLNKVMIIGNIGKDPEYKNLQNGKVANFSVATSRRYRDNNGEQKEQTDWHNVVVYGKMVDTMQNLHICKGTSLYVEGELRNRSWTDQTTGQKRHATEVQCSSFQILSPRQNNPSSNPYSRQNTQMGTPQTMPETDYMEDDSGLPF